MTAVRFADVDPITEFRLRHWARQNYAAAEDRSPSWHRVVLDEMRRRDAELEETGQQTTAGASYVPLPPSDSGLRRVDEPHNTAGERAPREARSVAIGNTSRHYELRYDPLG